MPGGDGGQRSRGGRGRLTALKEDQRRKQLRAARLTLLAVGVALFVLGLVGWLGERERYVEWSADPRLDADETAMAMATAGLVAGAALGAAYVGLFVLAKRRPVAASVGGLAIYAVDQIIAYTAEPFVLLGGVWTSTILFLALLGAVMSAIAGRGGCAAGPAARP
jgi:hypothetical protein